MESDNRHTQGKPYSYSSDNVEGGFKAAVCLRRYVQRCIGLSKESADHFIHSKT